MSYASDHLAWQQRLTKEVRQTMFRPTLQMGSDYLNNMIMAERQVNDYNKPVSVFKVHSSQVDQRDDQSMIAYYPQGWTPRSILSSRNLQRLN